MVKNVKRKLSIQFRKGNLMELEDIIYHHTNGFERIYSAREIGTEERFLYHSVWGKFTEEQEKSYRKFNNPLPLARPEPTHHITVTYSVYNPRQENGTWKVIEDVNTAR